MDTPWGTEPEEEKAPGTHDKNLRKGQWAGSARERRKLVPLWPQRTMVWLGVTLPGGRAQLDLREPVWHGTLRDWKATQLF